MDGPTTAAEPLLNLKDSAVPDDLPSLTPLLREADATHWDLIVLGQKKTPGNTKIKAKRRHDLKAAARTVQLLVKALQGGYRFDDADALAKIEAITRAATVLEKEVQAFDRILSAD